MSACCGRGALPSNAGASNPALQPGLSQQRDLSPADSTSILKRLTKDVLIGSTVDPTNGDTGPHAISRALVSYGTLKKGQLLVCNFADSSGTAGKGTTVDVLDPTPGSKPHTYLQSSKIEGCDGDALSSANILYATGLTSGMMGGFLQIGKFAKGYGSLIKAPFDDADAFCSVSHYPEYIYVSDAKTGSIISFSVNTYGNPRENQVITGFGVNNGSSWRVLGPSGIQYNGQRKGSLCNDTLYIVDGVDDTIIAVSNSSSLLVKDQIIVKPGGKTFKGKYPKTTCAKLVYAGSPLNAPVASALLPNGNLIVANTKGGNKLVEVTSAGKLLATKTIDKSTVAHIFALLAIGTDDANIALFYTTRKDNTLHKLEQ
jgi:hypothetical protein